MPTFNIERPMQMAALNVPADQYYLMVTTVTTKRVEKKRSLTEVETRVGGWSGESEKDIW